MFSENEEGTFTCSKSSIETLEKDVKLVWTHFTPFSRVSSVDFEQVHVTCIKC